jgi:hypothetical protein
MIEKSHECANVGKINESSCGGNCMSCDFQFGTLEISDRWIFVRQSVLHTCDSFSKAVVVVLHYLILQGVKAESAPKTDFIPVEYYDVRHTKAAFKKLMRACIPSSPNPEPEQSFHK